MTVRVLHLRASNFLGGPERQVLSYAAADTSGEIETWIGTFVGDQEGAGFAAAARQTSVPVWECGAQGLLQSVKALKGFLREQQIALVCTHGYKATIVAWLACGPKRIPVIPFLRGWTGENLKVSIYERLEAALLHRCSRVVCLSATQAAGLAAESWMKDKVRVVVNAALAAPASPEDKANARLRLNAQYGIGPNDFCIASAGRLSPEKAPFVLLDAANQIAQAEPRSRFIIFGDGPLREKLERHSLELGLGDRVTFAGLTQEFRELLPGADLLINASDREQVPNVVLEAMAASVPVIATAVGAVNELLRDNCGVLVAPGHAKTIATEALALLRAPERMQAMSANARRRLETGFSMAAQHAQLKSLYAEVLPFVRFARAPLTSYPEISVVVPVRNEERHIAAVLDRLLEQDYPAHRFEIIVADGASTDATRTIVDDYRQRARTRISLVHNPRLLSSGGRNAGVLAGSGKIVLFVDGHAHIPGRHLLYDTARLMAIHQADCLARPQLLRAPTNNDFQDVIATARESVLGHGRDSTIYSMDFSGEVDPTSSGATYKRAVFDEVGLYDESFDACEDVEFNLRVKAAGKRCVIDPSLAVFYVPRSTLRGLFKQMFRYGKGRARVRMKHSKIGSFSQVVPAVLVLYFPLLPFIGLAPNAFLAWSALAPALLYVLAGAAFSLLGVPTLGLRAALMPLVYFAIHFGLGCGYWAGLLPTGSKHGSSMDLHRKSAAGGTQ